MAMKIEPSDLTLTNSDTPAFRAQRIVALKRELDDAMDMLAETATVLTNAGVPSVLADVELGIADRVRWLVRAKERAALNEDQ